MIFMSWSVSYLQTGDGWTWTTPSKTYVWFGHSFNPSFTDQGITGDWNGWASVSAYNARTAFDCTGLQTGNEVCMNVAIFDYSGSGGSASETMTARNMDYGYDLFSMTFTLDAGYSQYAAWMGVGLRTSEIHENGNYRTICSGGASAYIDWTISNLSYVFYYHPTWSGYTAVEGNFLSFYNGFGCEQNINHDGSSSYVGTAYAGYVWISSTSGDYHIYYVDSSGYIRKTKNGSKYRQYGASDITLGSTSTANAGYIWTDSADDHFLYWIAQDGNIVRTGSGYISSDMQ
jgi:hypothetical protein